jgi:hypothetical protein
MKTIHSKKLALFLDSRGFPVLAVEPDKKRPEFSVYKFNASLALEDAIGDYLRSKAAK